MTRQRHLYLPGTYNASPRLEELRAGTAYLTMSDLEELFEEMCDGQEGWGDGTRNITLAEFGSWLLGNHDLNDPGVREFLNYPPAEVLW